MKKTNVNSNAFYNTVKSIFGVLYPLITFPYISRVLMADNVGKISFGSSIISYFSLFASLGITTYAIRECSKVREDKQQLANVGSQIYSINIIATITSYVALLIILVFSKRLANYRTLICIQSASIIFTTLGADWLNTVMEDFKYIAYRTIIMQIVSLLLMFVFVRKPEHYLIYAVTSVVASSGANLVNIFYRRKFCSIKFVWNLNLKTHIKPILMLLSMQLAQTIYCNSDITILGLMKGDYEVGLYSTAVKIYNIVNTVIASIAWVVMPQLAECFSKKNYDDVNRLLKYSLNFIIVFGLPCVTGMIVIPKEMIYIAAGSEYLQGYIALKILAYALLCSFIGGWIGNMIMIPSGKELVCIKASIISAIANAVFNFLLIPKYGLNAAAFTTVISQFLSIVVSYKYVDSRIKVDGFIDMIKAPCVGCVFIFMIGTLFKMIFSSYVMIAIGTVVISVIGYFIILLILKNTFLASVIKIEK